MSILKIQIEDAVYSGSAVEIMERLRDQAFDAQEFPDVDSYIWYLQGNFTRATDRDCVLPEGDTECRARAIFGKLQDIGALTVLEES